jgi:NAD(P)H-nitrite reductase large subunit
MATHHVIIIGGGPAAINAIETLRTFEHGAASITLISDEPAYARMALPYWLSGQIPREHTLIADEAYYQRLGVTPRLGVRVTAIDPHQNTLRLDDGTTLHFDKLLIATGSRPIGLPVPGADLPGVQPLWTLAHTQRVLETAGGGTPRTVMIGSGFIGFIMLNAMYKKGWPLTVVEREAHVLPRLLDATGARIVAHWLGQKGVDLHCGTGVQAIHDSRGAKVVELDNGARLDADLVIMATGVRPNIELAEAAGIQTAKGGILVNDHLQTSFPHIYAAGDVACGPVYYSDTPEIHAIQPTAVEHGRVAGANMADQDVAYAGSLLMNVLDICGLQNVAYGNWLDHNAEEMVIVNPDAYIYRKLMWHGDEITGAMFVGRAPDVGMTTDIGMVKGIMQTRTRLGPWKEFLRQNPFDIRRAYVATRVAAQLAGTTLVGRPSQTRQYHYGGVMPKPQAGPGHRVYVGES